MCVRKIAKRRKWNVIITLIISTIIIILHCSSIARHVRPKKKKKKRITSGKNMINTFQVSHGPCIDRWTVFHLLEINVAVKSTWSAIMIRIAETVTPRRFFPPFLLFLRPLENASILLIAKTCINNIYTCRRNFLLYSRTPISLLSDSRTWLDRSICCLHL